MLPGSTLAIMGSALLVDLFLVHPKTNVTTEVSALFVYILHVCHRSGLAMKGSAFLFHLFLVHPRVTLVTLGNILHVHLLPF